MIIKGKFQGSIRELSSDQLRQLRNAALYRGLHGVAAALMRESVRRHHPSTEVRQQAG